ncbi:glucodextranase DOMON-like domain-containing protein [Halorussus aquaticus]|uniref:Glucodextranase DOMON-like domain-containing protein n=1 Tax=Halorussus aquaticus TaxID=2953748 RepID=A0ABD5PZ10_9EURY|nr:glucodextranase DOMON-like domain-containing protein [Halorussus aquaticus]
MREHDAISKESRRDVLRAVGGGRDDDANPNVVDLVTPDGVSQSEALSYPATEQATIPYLSL